MSTRADQRSERESSTATLLSHVAEFEHDIERILITGDEVQTKIRELGDRITEDYRGRELLLVGVLKGAFVFMADLVRAIDLLVESHVMAVSSYGRATNTAGVVRVVKDLAIDLAGRHVLLVEDIVDSGLTLSYVRKNLKARNPASLEVCALLVREGRQKRSPTLKYVGFPIQPAFVIGDGLDVVERYRNLPFVCTWAGSVP